MSSTVIVLGMHRSGTSCLAGLLEESGLYLGDVSREAKWNKKGNRENKKLWVVNDEILSINGGSWDNPPDGKISWTDALRAARDQVLADYSDANSFGMKDPRMVFTLPFWLEAIPDVKIVVSVRHPVAVANSLLKRNGMPLEKGIELWTKYNKKILEIVDASDASVICFDDPHNIYTSAFRRMANGLGLNPPAGRFDFFENTLRNSHYESYTLPVEAARLYSMLTSRAAKHTVMQPKFISALTKPKLSIIVVFYNMRREASRTLYSLSSKYQIGVDASEYEVIAIENSSTERLDNELVSDNIRYFYANTKSPSPVEAVNFGVRQARAPNIAVIVDGARMASPGLVSRTLSALKSNYQNNVVTTLSWHLGPKPQKVSALDGYDQNTEDALLKKAEWQSDGYRLFEISSLAPSSKIGFLGGGPSECSYFAMSRNMFFELGGFDTRFQSPGGGLCNQEFRDRFMSYPKVQCFLLLGEGVFHQIHGGIATNAPPDQHPMKRFLEEYKALMGKDYRHLVVDDIFYYGALPKSARPFIAPSIHFSRVKDSVNDVSPIAIGALGGSGTRVFAEVFRSAGLRIGDSLNGALDNLWFTVLLKRFEWIKSEPSPEEIYSAIDLFHEAMREGLKGRISEDTRQLLARIKNDLSSNPDWKPGITAKEVSQLESSKVALPDSNWGWKEPNTHIFLPHLNRRIPRLRYIHVYRDPLDMAFSRNIGQLKNWSALYGLNFPENERDLPAAQLRFWIVANRMAFDYGRRYMKGRFLIVSYEDLCRDPNHVWSKMRSLIPELANNSVDFSSIILPTSIGRSKNHDLSVLSQKDIDEANLLKSEFELFFQQA